VGLVAWCGWDVYAFALPAHQSEDFDGLVPGGPEPVRESGVELGDFAGFHGDVVLPHDGELRARDTDRATAARESQSP
jgi:hypothetical protein